MEEPLTAVSVNTASSTPQRFFKLKRRHLEDEYTPKSRHQDKKLPSASEVTEALASAAVPTQDEEIDLRNEDFIAVASSAQHVATSTDEAHKDVFQVEEQRLDGNTSLGSILSEPDFSASVLHTAGRLAHAPDVNEAADTHQVDVEEKQTLRAVEQTAATPRGHRRSTSEGSAKDPSDDEGTPIRRAPMSKNVHSASPTRTPRLRDFKLPLNTPHSLVGNALSSHHHLKSVTDTKQALRTGSEVDLISFQTPAPNQQRDAHASLRKFTSEDGEEMLLDMTPRIYSPKSIPIYTLHDLDQIKAEFDRSRESLETRVASLHIQIASSVSNTNHHKALAAQGESLHAEYSKKHVRKVTALKTDWERKTIEKLAVKDAKIAEQEAMIAELRAILAQEREEKKEVIAMAEAVLALQQES